MSKANTKKISFDLKPPNSALTTINGQKGYLDRDNNFWPVSLIEKNIDKLEEVLKKQPPIILPVIRTEHERKTEL